MSQQEDHVSSNEEILAETAAGPGADASGPAPQSGEGAPGSAHGDAPGDVAGDAPGDAPGDEDELTADDLTVEDILGEAQSDEAKIADPLQDTANPYLDDLRRLTAEYANYRKRTADNAEIEKQRAKAAAVNPLLSVLDDLDRAEAHGDLEEGSAFLAIAQKLRASFERMGLVGFGEKGEAFDPQKHEAIAQLPMPGTEQPTVLDVVERGYTLGEVELRPAKVAVAVPTDG